MHCKLKKKYEILSFYISVLLNAYFKDVAGLTVDTIGRAYKCDDPGGGGD